MREIIEVKRKPGGDAPHRHVPVRWDAQIEEAFLKHLAATANVMASARAAGVGKVSAYRHRAADPAFRAMWDAALDEAYARLETMLLSRALNGVFRSVWHGGKRVGKEKEYSDRLALELIARRRGSGRDAPDAAATAEAETRARIEEKLAEMSRRLSGEG